MPQWWSVFELFSDNIGIKGHFTASVPRETETWHLDYEVKIPKNKYVVFKLQTTAVAEDCM